MGIYREHFTTTELDSASNEEWDTWEIYEQPAWRHYLHVALAKVTGWTHELEYRLDPLAERWHRLSCHDDCFTGQVRRLKPGWRTPEKQAEREAIGFNEFFKRDDVWDTTVETYCGRDPLCLAVDMKVYHFGRKQRRLLGTLDGPHRPMED